MLCINDLVMAELANTNTDMLWRVIRITPDRVVELSSSAYDTSILMQESNLIGKKVFRETVVLQETAAEAKNREFSQFFNFDTFGTDARQWAKAFCSRFKLAAPDEVIMLSWFKCAIDAGRENANMVPNGDPDDLARFTRSEPCVAVG